MFNDLSGKRFGRLTAIDKSRLRGKTYWRCRCDCGTETLNAYQHLVNGLTKSCGCLRREKSAENLRKLKTTHGQSKRPGYETWAGMMDRCFNPSSLRYHRYGGRGIQLCERWINPANFLDDMGEPSKGMTIERIDNDGNYEPSNCVWASKKDQNNNRSTTRKIEFNGETHSAAKWAEIIGITKATMYARLRKWPLDRALTEARGPTHKRR